MVSRHHLASNEKLQKGNVASISRSIACGIIIVLPTIPRPHQPIPSATHCSLLANGVVNTFLKDHSPACSTPPLCSETIQYQAFPDPILYLYRCNFKNKITPTQCLLLVSEHLKARIAVKILSDWVILPPKNAFYACLIKFDLTPSLSPQYTWRLIVLITSWWSRPS